MKKLTKIQQILKSDAFFNFKEIIEITTIDYDHQIISLVEHLITGASGNAEQLSTWILNELKKDKIKNNKK